MQKTIVTASLAFVAVSCNRKFTTETNEFNPGTSDINSKFTSMTVTSLSAQFKTMNIDVNCPKGLDGINDWKDSFTIQDTEPNFKIVKNSDCTITLKNYFDGANTFSPKGPALEIAISATGIITLTKTVEYSVSPADPDNKPWFFAAGGNGAYKLVINHGNDPKKVTNKIETVNMETVTVSAGSATNAPNVTNVKISKSPRNNGEWDYSLIGKAEDAGACKILEASLVTNYDYNSINQAFNASNGAVTCPDNLLKGTQGNWNNFAKSDKVIIWQSTDPNAAFFGYTYLVLPKLN